MTLQRLTATEARIAGLLVGGRRDEEITDELALGPTHLERHLAEVYRKLGVCSRAELALLFRTNTDDEGRKR